MDIASMVDLIEMIKHLDEGNERISDWVFTSDGKSIVVDLTSGESYRFSVGQDAITENTGGRLTWILLIKKVFQTS